MSSLGRTISGGANVLRGYERGVQAQRVAREQQLMIEEKNRLDRLRQLSTQQPLPQAPDFSGMLGEPTPVVDMTPKPAAPAAPAAPATPPQPTTGGGRGNILPPLVGQPQPVYPPTGVQLNAPYVDPAGYTPPAGMSGPEQLRRLRESRMERFQNLPQAAQATQAAVAQRTGQQPAPFDARTGFAVEPSAAAPAAPAAPTAPKGEPTKKAQQYDKRTTPYDGLMTEAAQQYGLDPVMFKRLIGTESSFNPNAVSPRGAQFGLGIAQINAVHGLSDADRLNPQIAIPFAARLYSQYLREAGGNHEEALMRYKGATSAQGRAAMQTPINTILSGTTAAPAAAEAERQAAFGGAPAPAAPAATTPVEAVAEVTRKDPADFYLANPQAIPRDMQLALRNRQELVRMATLFQQAGMGNQFMEVRTKIMELDDNMFYLQGMQGLQEIELANDPRRLSTVWSQATGANVNVVPRTDGKFNLVVNGRVTRDGLDASTVADLARSSFDVAFRKQKAEASAKFNEKMQESMLKIQEGNALELARMIRETTVEGVKGNNALTLEWAKANMNWDIKPTGGGDGMVIIRPPGSPPYLFNPTGTTITIDGVQVPANSARLIGGLPQQTQARLNQVR